MDADHLNGALQLALAPGRQQRLLRHASSFARACAQLPEPDPGLVARTLSWLDLENTHIVHWFHPAYPDHLRAIHKPPLALFCHGNSELLNAFQIAFVGSRKASPGGLHTASYLAEKLCERGAVITSGLALGIDAAAHRAALAVGTSVAVIGTGADRYYPPRNRQLQQQLASSGLVVSEFPPGWPAKADHFPRRNRIIAGLSQGVVVVEAVENSGSLITARLALEQGREVFAVPHSMWEPAGFGCNRLIQQGAKLVLTEEDIFNEFPSWLNGPTTPAKCTENKCLEGLANAPLLANVGNEVTSIDVLVARSGLSVAVVTEQLVLLELEGLVASVPGGFIRMGRR
ncbi:MAG: DNA-processing protein DprA [Idiomarina sp.]